MQSGSLALNGPVGAASGQVLSDTRGHLPAVVGVYLILLLVPATLGAGSFALTGPRVLLLALFIPMMADLFSGKSGRVYPVDYLFFLSMLWATVALFANNPDKAVQNAGSTAAEFLGGYMLGRTYIRSPEAFIAVIRFCFKIVLVSIPFGVLEMMDGRALWPDLFNRLPAFRGWPDVSNPPRMGLERVQVFFAHPIHYGLFCSLFVALFFLGLRPSLTLGKRLFMTGIALLGTFMALSSAPLLSSVLQIGLIIWAYIFRNMKTRWWLLLVPFALMYVTIDVLSNRTPIKVLMSYATFSPHNAYYRAIINQWGMINVWQNPILGLGLRDWIRPSFMHHGSVDNFWLVIAMRYGIPGFVLLALGYADAVIRVGRAKISEASPVKDLRQAWTITMVGMSFVLYTVHVWTSVYSFIFFLIGAALWIPDWARNQQSPQAPGTGTPVPAGVRPGAVYSRSPLEEDRSGIEQAGPAGVSGARRDQVTYRHSRFSEDDAAGPGGHPTAPGDPLDRAERDAPSYTRFRHRQHERAGPDRDPAGRKTTQSE